MRGLLIQAKAWARGRPGVHTWKPNQELVIPGNSTWELCYFVVLKLECQYKGVTQGLYLKLNL